MAESPQTNVQTSRPTNRAGLAQRMAIIIVALIVTLTFAGALRNDFVNWDDDYTLVHNDAYKGLSTSNLKWMFTTGFAGHYQPLSWLSFAVDHAVWGGVDPTGFHLTNILLHTVAVCGFLLVATQLIQTALRSPLTIGVVMGGAAAALLFGVHPLRVESVAWATERRDVLSAALLMPSLLCYIRYVETRERRAFWFVLAIICFCFSLLAKASAMMMPIVLLLLDYYPFRRFQENSQVARRTIFAEKVAFLIPATVVAVLAATAQRASGAMWSLSDHSLTLRAAQAFYGLVFYVWKTVVPYPLIALYEQPPDAVALSAVNIISAVVIFTIFVALFLLRRRMISLWVAWLSYVTLVLPLLGLAQSGPQLVADRYSYLSCMPFAVALGGLVAMCWSGTRSNPAKVKALIATITVAVSATLVWLSTKQTAVWRNSLTLWRHVLDHAPDTGLAHTNLAALYNSLNQRERACTHALRALSILPGNRGAHLAAGQCHSALGNLKDAESHFRTVLTIRPGDEPTMLKLADVLTRAGKLEEAEGIFRSLIDRNPESAIAHLNLAGCLTQQQRSAEAVSLLRQAIEKDPALSAAYYRLAILHANSGELELAIRTARAGLAMTPDDQKLNAKLATWLIEDTSLRNPGLAMEHANRAIIDGEPVLVEAWEAKALAFAAMGDVAAAQAYLSMLLTDPTIELSAGARERIHSRLDRFRSETQTE